MPGKGIPNNVKNIPLDKFQKGRLVKTDGYGIIYTAYWTDKSRQVSLKYIPTYQKTAINIQDMSEEIDNLKKKTHPNITQVIGISEDDERQAIVIVLQNTDSNLREYLIKKNRIMKWSDRLKLAIQITSGLDFLHSLDYIHRNLHSLNIFISHEKAIIMDPRLSIIVDETQTLNTLKRMIPFVAPEELEDSTNIPDFKCDIYSLAVILWEISSGREPFPNEDPITLAQSIINNRRESAAVNTPPKYIKLYTRSWDRNPEIRPEVSDILRKLKNIFSELYPKDWKIFKRSNETLIYNESRSNETKKKNNTFGRLVKESKKFFKGKA